MSTSVVARGTRERRRSCSERAGSCVCRGVSAEVSSIWVGEKVKAAGPGRAVTLSATSARPQLCRAQPALSWRPGSSQASCGPSRVSRSKTQVSAGDSLQCPEHTQLLIFLVRTFSWKQTFRVGPSSVRALCVEMGFRKEEAKSGSRRPAAAGSCPAPRPSSYHWDKAAADLKSNAPCVGCEGGGAQTLKETGKVVRVRR